MVPNGSQSDVPAPDVDRTGSLLVILLLLSAVLLVVWAWPATPPAALPPDPPATDVAGRDTEVLSPALADTATIRQRVVYLDDPLVALYAPGRQPVIQPGAEAGVIVDGDQAAVLVAVACPAWPMPPGVAAVCLNAAGLTNRVGTYVGQATIVPAIEADEAENGDDGSPVAVPVQLIVRRHWTIFAALAVLGTFISLFATWFISERQRILQLQTARDDLLRTASTVTCDSQSPGAAGSPLSLGPPDLDAEPPLPTGFWALVNRWLEWLAGYPLQIDAFEKKLQRARDERAAFLELCRVRAALLRDKQHIAVAYRRLGYAGGSPRLLRRIEQAIEDGPSVIDSAAAPDLVAEWALLHRAAVQWMVLAHHLVLLCAATRPEDAQTHRQSFDLPPEIDVTGLTPDAMAALAKALAGKERSSPCPPNVDDSEAGRELAVRFEAARLKLDAAASLNDLELLEPETDIQAAYLALARLEAQQRAAGMPVLPGAMVFGAISAAVAGELAADARRDEPLFWQRLGDWVSTALERWSPLLNRATLWALLVLSLATTIFAGLQLLYVGKPWGTLTDMAFLVLIGTGVHTGLTGLAAAIRTRTA